MQPYKKALLDLGTNTFNLWLVKITGQEIEVLADKEVPVTIGKGGISEGKITKEAQERIHSAFNYFQSIFHEHQIPPSEVRAVATSAFRNAHNAAEIQQEILSKFGITIEIINGEQEAELIYHGVRKAIEITEEKTLIMDIGGGSVEFIIANATAIFWKQSFEIGAQRLLDMFYQQDPISQEAIKNIYDFLENALLPLHEAFTLHQPKMFIGASGTFDTLVEMEYYRENPAITTPLPEEKSFMLSKTSFGESFQLIIHQNREERLQIRGLWNMRVDMIVVATILLKFVMEKYNFSEIAVSMYSLREGLLFSNLS